MSKLIALALALCLSSAIYAAPEYTLHSAVGTIHITQVKSKWCGNLAISTKVGNKSGGQCIYAKETQPQGVDDCGPFELNGYRLENNAGAGFNCAATHVHSNAFGDDAVDEYDLKVNDGHYVSTMPHDTIIELS